MMQDYLELRTAVIEMTGRLDTIDQIDRLTKLAEARFERELRLSDQISSTSLTVSSGLSSLPADFLEVIGLTNATGVELVAQSPQYAGQTGATAFYSIEGDQIVTKAADGDYILKYYAAIPTLTSGLTSTNWLLSSHPGVYLYGLGCEVAKYVSDADRAAAYSTALAGELDQARERDRQRRYSRARVRVRGVTP